MEEFRDVLVAVLGVDKSASWAGFELFFGQTSKQCQSIQSADDFAEFLIRKLLKFGTTQPSISKK